MMLKYESEILFELMKRDGDDTPSDVLPYESELKEKYLEQVEGAYPKLQDYRSEWLNYNLNAHLPADFPVESVSNVTNATFENVVPYAYKSAILKGQTLVNIKGNQVTIGAVGRWGEYLVPTVKPNTRYLITYDLESTSSRVAIGFLKNTSTWSNNLEEQGLKGQFILNSGDEPNYFRVGGLPDTVTTVKGLNIIEYQEGMENWDIPFFEGMQSVKMPVLTTTGKNLFNESEKIEGYFTSNSSKEQLETDIKNTWTTPWIKAKTNTSYTIQGGNRNRWQIKSHNNVITFMENKTITTLSDTEYIRCYYCNETYIASNVQLEESSSATSYEPYKTNILSTSEEVKLRGIGDAKDTLDCLTGEVTERIGEIVLDGRNSQIVGFSSTATNTIYFYVPNNLTLAKGLPDNAMSDTLPYPEIDLSSDTNDFEAFHITSKGHMHVRLLKTRLNEISINGVKSYLQSNPITIQYELSEKSIKTVDLTVTDQDGNTKSIIRPIEGTMHVSTSSQTLQPLLDMSVPVEATIQNLMSFANIEEEE